MSKSERRDFLKGAGVAAAAVAGTTAGSLVGAGKADAQSSMKVNPNARAVMPNGAQMSRPQVLQQLGLDPSTPPDAWLAITTCGSNASALTDRQIKTLDSKGQLKLNSQDLRSLQGIKGIQLKQ